MYCHLILVVYQISNIRLSNRVSKGYIQLMLYNLYNRKKLIFQNYSCMNCVIYWTSGSSERDASRRCIEICKHIKFWKLRWVHNFYFFWYCVMGIYEYTEQIYLEHILLTDSQDYIIKFYMWLQKLIPSIWRVTSLEFKFWPKFTRGLLQFAS